jgi:hypothetical protein
MIAPGTHPTPSTGAVTAAPIPQPTAAPPRAPSVAFVPGLAVHAARASIVPAVRMILIAFSFTVSDACAITRHSARITTMKKVTSAIYVSYKRNTVRNRE